MIPEVHLKKTDPVTRHGTDRAFRLCEDGQPVYDNSKNSLLKIIDFLDVERSARYKPGRGLTFCNIYAYDYATLCGAYLPRVWWKEPNEVNENTRPVYGDNVREMNVNSLYRWFPEYGEAYGWKEVKTMTEAQELANQGLCVVALAANKDKSKSGHITCVIPEHGEHQAKRIQGVITKPNTPIQSQAGTTNKKVFTKYWWTYHERIKFYVNLSTSIL